MTKPIHDAIEKSLQNTYVRSGIYLIEFNTDTEHAHVLISYPPKYSISEIVRAFKINSSRKVRIECADEIRDKLWGNHFWSPSYFVSSTGGSSLDVVKQYVENQKQPPKPAGNPNLIWYGQLHSSPPPRKGSPGVD